MAYGTRSGDDKLLSLQKQIRSLLKVSSFTKSPVTVTAGSTSGRVEIGCTEPGYTPLGIVAITKGGTHSSYCIPYDWFIEDAAAAVYLRNIGASDASIYVRVDVLMIKSSL